MVKNSDIEKYFLQILPEIFPSDECRALLTLVAGERPGVLLMSVEKEDEELVRNFCRDFGLELEFLGERNDMLNPGAFITREPGRFEILEDSHGKFYTCTDEAVGKFLGYPEEAVKYYSKASKKEEEDKVPGRDFEAECGELFELDVLSEEDLKHLQLVDYVPRPEKESILDAVRKGKEKKEKLRAFDQEQDTRVAEIYLKELFDRFELEQFLTGPSEQAQGSNSAGRG